MYWTIFMTDKRITVYDVSLTGYYTVKKGFVEDGKSSNSIVVCRRVMSCLNPPKVYRNIVS